LCILPAIFKKPRLPNKQIINTMKKLALPSAFFSFCCALKKIKTDGILFHGVLISSLIFAAPCYSQQVIGSFPTMDGGIEGHAVTGLGFPIGTASYANGATVTVFSRNNNNAATTCAFVRATGGNSSPKCISWTNASTSAELFTPTAIADAVLPSTSYVVQFFARQDTSDKSRSFNVRVSVNGNSFGGAVTTAQSGSLSYQKFTAIVSTPALAGSGKTGYFGIKPNGGSFNSLNYLLDDFCMYAGSAVDNTAPDEVVSPSVTSYTSTSLNLGWTAPGTGVDGGGYVVIRYATNPVSEPAPIVNGIYAVGNTIGTGTIVSIGTATSFNNTGLASNTAYYYRIYVADKAFNYSPTPVTVAGYTGTAGPTAITFTTPATCLTDRITISWTGPLNYNSANNTLLGFLKAGSAVTVGTPTNALASYTASTTFGTGAAYQNDAAAYCIINGDGTNSAGDHSGLTITGLTPGTTYYVLLFNVVNATVTYSAGSTGNGTTLNSLAEPANNPTAFAKGVVTTSNPCTNWIFDKSRQQCRTR
jgi:trimeric autotransporter adhesin